jgi:hypothetical protein
VEEFVVRDKWFLAGFLLAAWIVSLISGGYVLYVNGLLVGVLADPLIIVFLRIVLSLIGLWLLAGLLLAARTVYATIVHYRSVPWSIFSFLYGFSWFLATIFMIYGIASSMVAAVAGLAVVPLLIAIYAGYVGRKWRSLLLASFLLLVAIGLFHLYEPIASAQHIDAEETGTIIDVNGLKRFIPLMTAYAYASDRVQSPIHRIYPGDSYVYYNSSHSVYNWVVEPEGFWNEVTKKPLGVVFVYGDQYPPQVVFVHHALRWGLHNKEFKLLYVDSLLRRVVIASGLRYKPLPEDNIEVMHGGKVYILVPVKGWDRGLLYSVPVLAGYVIVGENGATRFVPRGQLSGENLLKGLPLLPEEIARSWAEKYRASVGFTNYYFYHNTYVIRDVGTNPQPYLEQDESGRQYWVFVAEPAGKTYSAKYIIYVDAETTGRPRLVFYELPKPVIGVSKVASYVKQAHPVYDWSQLSIEEPMPTIINGTLYWKTTITTKDYRGLVSVDIVNAGTGQVLSLVPRHQTSYLDLVMLLSKGEKPAGGTIQERIESIEKRIDKLIDELEALKKELEELKSQFNETK